MLLDKEIMGTRKICSKPARKATVTDPGPVCSQAAAVLPSHTPLACLLAALPLPLPKAGSPAAARVAVQILKRK